MTSLLGLFLVAALGYIANYGYSDASGDYYISIDSDKCDGCGMCVDACPENALEVALDDYDQPVARVRDKVVRNLRYICSPCKGVGSSGEFNCQVVCSSRAIYRSW